MTTKTYPASRYMDINVTKTNTGTEFTLYNTVSGLPVGKQLDSGEIVPTQYPSYQAAKAAAQDFTPHYRTLERNFR